MIPLMLRPPSNQTMLQHPHPKNMPRLHLISVAVGAVLVLTCGPADGSEVPKDFALTATFYPGGGGNVGSGRYPWQLRVNRNGKAVQKTSIFTANTTMRVQTVVKTKSLSRDALRRVVTAIEKADFLKLPQTLSNTTYEHYASVVVKVTMNGRTHEVEFLAPNKTYDAAALRRFWTVWRALLKIMPSPNKNEEMLFWIRHQCPDLAQRSNQAMPFRLAGDARLYRAESC